MVTSIFVVDMRCHAEQREASPRYTLYYVILSVTKDLKACATVQRHGDLEILHFVQNDRVVCHAERSRSIPSLATRYPRSRLSALRRFFVTLRMTTQAIIANY